MPADVYFEDLSVLTVGGQMRQFSLFLFVPDRQSRDPPLIRREWIVLV